MSAAEIRVLLELPDGTHAGQAVREIADHLMDVGVPAMTVWVPGDPDSYIIATDNDRDPPPEPNPTIETLDNPERDRAGLDGDILPDTEIAHQQYNGFLWGARLFWQRTFTLRALTFNEPGQEGIELHDCHQFRIIDCAVHRPGSLRGRILTSGVDQATYGEGLYLTDGCTGGHITRLTVTGADLRAAEAVDIKPGCHDIVIDGLRVRDVNVRNSGAVAISIGHRGDPCTGIRFTDPLIDGVTCWSDHWDGNGITLGGPAELIRPVIRNTQHHGILFTPDYDPKFGKTRIVDPQFENIGGQNIAVYTPRGASKRSIEDVAEIIYTDSAA